MAYHWFMTVEAESEEAAKSFSASFDCSSMMIHGHLVGFSVSFVRDELYHGIIIFPFFVPTEGSPPEGVAPRNGAESVEHAQLLTDIGNVLYSRLLRTTPFDIAILGVECESFFGFGEHDDLVDDLRQGWTCDGLVISADLWKSAEEPKDFIPRTDGTFWCPWRGEVFKESA